MHQRLWIGTFTWSILECKDCQWARIPVLVPPDRQNRTICTGETIYSLGIKQFQNFRWMKSEKINGSFYSIPSGRKFYAVYTFITFFAGDTIKNLRNRLKDPTFKTFLFNLQLIHSLVWSNLMVVRGLALVGVGCVLHAKKRKSGSQSYA